jgi:hypothetical protein
LKADEGMPEIIGLIKMRRNITLSGNRARLKTGATVTHFKELIYYSPFYT